MPDTEILTGVVHGRTIELDRELAYPEGQVVSLVIQPMPTMDKDEVFDFQELVGTWSDDPEGLDDFLEWTRQQRRLSRQEVE